MKELMKTTITKIFSIILLSVLFVACEEGTESTNPAAEVIQEEVEEVEEAPVEEVSEFDILNYDVSLPLDSFITGCENGFVYEIDVLSTEVQVFQHDYDNGSCDNLEDTYYVTATPEVFYMDNQVDETVDGSFIVYGLEFTEK